MSADERLGQEQLELLSAYADGTLDEAGQTEADTLLAHSEAAREVLAEVMRIQADIETSGTVGAAEPVVRPIGVRRGPRVWRVGVGLAIAASIALALWPRTGADFPLGVTDPAGIVARTGWDERPWGSVRGPEESSRERASFRSGVLWTDVRVGVAGGDADAARAGLEQIEALVQSVALSTPLAARLRTLDPGDPAGSTSRGFEETRNALCASLDCALFEVGSRLEAARLWARYDRGAEGLASLMRGLGSQALDADGADRLERIRALLATQPVDYEALTNELDAVIARLAR